MHAQWVCRCAALPCVRLSQCCDTVILHVNDFCWLLTKLLSLPLHSPQSLGYVCHQRAVTDGGVCASEDAGVRRRLVPHEGCRWPGSGGHVLLLRPIATSVAASNTLHSNMRQPCGALVKVRIHMSNAFRKGCNCKQQLANNPHTCPHQTAGCHKVIPLLAVQRQCIRIINLSCAPSVQCPPSGFH